MARLGAWAMGALGRFFGLGKPTPAPRPLEGCSGPISGLAGHVAGNPLPGLERRGSSQAGQLVQLGAVTALVQLAGCAVISGPCQISKGNIICDEGGRVYIMKPAHTIETSGLAAEKIVKAIADDPNKTDPKILVPPRSRH